MTGTVDSRRDFDRKFRPTSNRVRQRWERLDLAQRRGVSLPPIDVYRVGDLHFVKDGHHRVSVARASGQKTIEAYVTEVLTRIPATGISRRGGLPLKAAGSGAQSRAEKIPAIASQPTGLTRCDSLAAVLHAKTCLGRAPGADRVDSAAAPEALRFRQPGHRPWSVRAGRTEHPDLEHRPAGPGFANVVQIRRVRARYP